MECLQPYHLSLRALQLWCFYYLCYRSFLLGLVSTLDVLRTWDGITCSRRHTSGEILSGTDPCHMLRRGQMLQTFPSLLLLQRRLISWNHLIKQSMCLVLSFPRHLKDAHSCPTYGGVVSISAFSSFIKVEVYTSSIICLGSSSISGSIEPV